MNGEAKEIRSSLKWTAGRCERSYGANLIPWVVCSILRGGDMAADELRYLYLEFQVVPRRNVDLSVFHFYLGPENVDKSAGWCLGDPLLAPLRIGFFMLSRYKSCCLTCWSGTQPFL